MNYTAHRNVTIQFIWIYDLIGVHLSLMYFANVLLFIITCEWHDYLTNHYHVHFITFIWILHVNHDMPLLWQHNGCVGVWNHQPNNCLLNCHSGADQRKHQSSASMAFVQGNQRWPVNSPHKWAVTQKMFPFDDVIMQRYQMLWIWLCLLGECFKLDFEIAEIALRNDKLMHLFEDVS